MMIFRRMLMGVTAGYWLLAVLLTHLPKPPSVGPDLGDKTQHLAGYGLLAGLLYLTLWVSRPTMRWPAVWTLAIVLGYGAIDEWTQPLTGRTCDIRDWLADVSGSVVAVGFLVGARWLWERPRRVRRAPELVGASRS